MESDAGDRAGTAGPQDKTDETGTGSEVIEVGHGYLKSDFGMRNSELLKMKSESASI
jgi:hypothetical protein